MRLQGLTLIYLPELTQEMSQIAMTRKEMRKKFRESLREILTFHPPKRRNSGPNSPLFTCGRE